MSAQTDAKLTDLAKWYHHHRPLVCDQSLDLMQRVQFLEKTIENLVLLQTYVAEDLQRVEGRNHLWTPGSVQMNGDLKRFG